MTYRIVKNILAQCDASHSTIITYEIYQIIIHNFSRKCGYLMDAGMFLCMKYNKLVLTLAEACEELGMAVGTAHNKIGRGTFPVPSRIAGKSRVVDVRDLGEYMDREREQARQVFGI